MKIAGRKIEGASRKTVTIKRNKGDIQFVFEAVLSDKEFEALCPRPTAGQKILPGGVKKPDFENPVYLKKLDEWALQKTYWTFLKSISATENLEWETVDLSNPSTWKNYTAELEAAGFSPAEQYKLLEAYMFVNGLDETKVDEAVESFLASPQETQEN